MAKRSKLISFKTDLLKGNVSARSLMYSIKSTHFNIADYRSIIHDLYTGRVPGGKSIFSGLLPPSYDLLRKAELSYIQESLGDELIFNFALIEKYTDKISSFLYLKKIFETQILTGDLEAAGCTLREIEDTVCVSIWTLENRFLLAQLKDGIEENRQFLGSVNNDDLEWILGYLADFYSFKAEHSTSVQQYSNRVNKLLEILEQGNPVAAAYFTFKLYHAFDFVEKSLIHILFMEGRSSIIDRYMTTIKVIQLIVSSQGSGRLADESRIVNIAKMIVRELQQNLKDSSLERLRTLFNPTEMVHGHLLTSRMSRISHVYTSAKYDESLELCKVLLNEEPTCFELYEYYTKSAMYMGLSLDNNGIYPVPLQTEIIDCMLSVYSRSPDTLERLRRIQKIALIFGQSEFAFQLINFHHEHLSIEVDQQLQTLSHLASTFYNPRFSVSYHLAAEGLSYLSALNRFYGHNVTITLYEIIIQTKIDPELKNLERGIIPSHRLERFLAESGYSFKPQDTIERLDSVLSGLSKLPDAARRYLLEKITVNLYRLYLSDGNIKRSLSVYVDTYLDDPIMTLRMDVSPLVAKLRVSRDKTLIGNIDVPILYYLFYRSDYANIYRAYANFIDTMGLTRPTDLRRSSTDVNQKKLVFFLRNVCTVEVMKPSLIFRAPEDVRRERIAVLQRLMELDPDNSAEYVEEISYLTQRLRINVRARQIDESRIDVDIKSIKEDTDNSFKEIFNRYLTLGGISDVEVVDLFSNVSLGDQTLQLLNVNSSSLRGARFVLFKEAFLELRDQFTFNEKFGLDSSLSTRIRHGSLMNQLRNPFETKQLILSKKDENSPTYELNKYWITFLEQYETDDGFKDVLRECLEEFSRGVDATIEAINRDWIRIRTETRGESGLFDFTMDYLNLMTIYATMVNITEKDEFYDRTMAYMWKITEYRLKEIRIRVESILSNTFLDLLEELGSNISKLEDDYFEYGSILRDIQFRITNARTDIQNQIMNLSKWFNVSEKKDDSDFDATLWIDTCLEINKTLNPHFSEATIHQTIECSSLFQGYAFPHVVDIMNILLSNAIKHSQFDDLQDLEIVISVIENGRDIILRMENNLSETIDLQALNEKLNENARRLDDDSYIRQHNTKEGGSGYVKIRRILQYNLWIDNNFIFSFSISSENKYIVEIVMGKAGIVKIVEEERVS